MSGIRSDDVVFHLKFQAEIYDEVARITASRDDKEKARQQAAALRAQAGQVDHGPIANFG